MVSIKDWCESKKFEFYENMRTSISMQTLPKKSVQVISNLYK